MDMGGISQAFKHCLQSELFVQLSHAWPEAPVGHLQGSVASTKGWITHTMIISGHLVGMPLHTVIANDGA